MIELSLAFMGPLPTALQSLVAFFALAIMDICWVVCVKHTTDNNPMLASNWAVALFFAGSVGIIGYTTNHWLLIPAALGTWCGTYIAVWWNQFIDSGRQTVLALMQYHFGGQR